jgi:circadian clock protein KaiC
VFGAKFLCRGVKDCDEAGIYVSFAENKETFIHNTTRHLGSDSRKYFEEGRCGFLDFVTVKEEGMSSVLKVILDEVRKAKARRLIIDSFSAMSQAFETKIDARIILHTILGKLVRELGCTTVLISEIPRGEEHIGTGMEEFVADGVIMLRKKELDGRNTRELEILKMRGTRIDESRIPFTLYGGFEAFLPLQPKLTEKPSSFQPVPDPPNLFSSGIPKLDQILGGGYPRGSTVLFEMSENVSDYEGFIFGLTQILNFITQDNPVLVFPPVGVDASIIEHTSALNLISEEELNRSLRWCVTEADYSGSPNTPLIYKYTTDSIPMNQEKFLSMAGKLTQNNRLPLLTVMGTDTLFSHFSEKITESLNIIINMVRTGNHLCLLLLKPGLPSPHIYNMLRATTRMHFKMIREHGVPLFYGVKPRTGLMSVNLDATKVYPFPKLTPII